MTATEQLTQIAADPYRFGITTGWLPPSVRANEKDITEQIRSVAKDVAVFDIEFNRGVRDAESGIGFWVDTKGVTHYGKTAKT